jgi:hypothetical protein
VDERQWREFRAVEAQAWQVAQPGGVGDPKMHDQIIVPGPAQISA